MNRIIRPLSRLLLATAMTLAALVPLGAQAHGNGYVVRTGGVSIGIGIGTPPPPARVEVVPAGPRGYVWSPGYWAWDGYNYFWVDGSWMRQRPGYVYVPGRWDRHDEYWRYAPGRWEGHEHHYRDHDRGHGHGHHR